MQIIDPINNPPTVDLSTLNVGDLFTAYDITAGLNLHFLVLSITGAGVYNALKFEDNSVNALGGSTQVVPRTGHVVFSA